MFFFPIASFVFGKVDFKYLTFGALCFFWGLFMIAQNISGYQTPLIIYAVITTIVLSVVVFFIFKG